MPHLQIRNKYWLIGGDELLIPAVFSIIGRVLWTILIVMILYLDFEGLLGCRDSQLLLLYLFLAATLFFLSILCDVLIIFVSLHGTMVETEKRKSIKPLITIRSLIAMIQLISAVTGLVGISISEHIPCNASEERTDANKAILSIVLISQVVDVLLQTCCSYLVSRSEFPMYGDDHSFHDEESLVEQWQDSTAQVLRQVQFYCCSPYNENIPTNVGKSPQQSNDNLEAIARILTKLFHHDGFLDVVPSDVIAGLILVRIMQKSKRMKITAEHNQEMFGKMNRMLLNTDHHTINDLRRGISILPEGKIRMLQTQLSNIHNPVIITTPPSTGQSNIYSPSSFNSNTIKSRQIRSYTTVSNCIDHAEDIDKLSILVHYIKYAALMYSYFIPVSNGLTIQTCLACQHCAGLSPPRHGLQLCGWWWFGSSRLASSGGSTSANYIHFPLFNHKLLDPRLSMNSGFSSRGTTKGNSYPESFYCAWNRTGINHTFESLPESDLVLYSQRNDSIHKPYTLFLDHGRQTVVIAIRGTVSIEDCITDVLCDPVEVSYNICSILYTFIKLDYYCMTIYNIIIC
jgi:hypothetical protein